MNWSGWGTPVDIPVPLGGESNVLPRWSELKFNPLGLFNLRRHLGAFPAEQGIFMRYKHRFLGSDIAWFSAGLHKDGNHATPSNTYHSLFSTARQHTPTGNVGTKIRNELRDSVKSMVFDMVSTLNSTYNLYA